MSSQILPAVLDDLKTFFLFCLNMIILNKCVNSQSAYVKCDISFGIRLKTVLLPEAFVVLFFVCVCVDAKFFRG